MDEVKSTKIIKMTHQMVKKVSFTNVMFSYQHRLLLEAEFCLSK